MILRTGKKIYNTLNILQKGNWSKYISESMTREDKLKATSCSSESSSETVQKQAGGNASGGSRSQRSIVIVLTLYFSEGTKFFQFLHTEQQICPFSNKSCHYLTNYLNLE